jgi:hypothetical protein
VGSSALAGVGLYWLGSLDTSTSAGVALTAATFFGIGRTFLWPTMIGVTAELFPRGGPLLLSLMGGAGMLSVGLVLAVMGAQMDKYGPGSALQLVAGLGAILTVIFGGSGSASKPAAAIAWWRFRRSCREVRPRVTRDPRPSGDWACGIVGIIRMKDPPACPAW